MRKSMLVLYAMAGVVILVGCGGPGDGSGDEEIETIGLTVQDLGNPFFTAVQEGAETQAEEIGAEVSVQDGQQDLAQQSQHIDDFITRGVDFIVLNAVDSEGIGPAVQRATEADIPVVAVDVGAEGADATITSDNVEAGRLACDYIVEQLDGEGNIAIVDGTPITSVLNRVEGCEEVLEENPDIEVVARQQGDNSRTAGQSLGQDILTANSDLDAIFAINDPTGLGVELAAEQAGRDDFFISAVDGSPDAVESLEEDGVFDATAAQSPYTLAQTAVQNGETLAKGEELEETEILEPVSLVTRDNLDEYEGWER